MARHAGTAAAAVFLFLGTMMTAHATMLPTLNATSIKATALAKLNATATALATKPNATTALATLAAMKNLTTGAALTLLPAPPAGGGPPTGTLQCLVTAEGLVAGIVSDNGNFACTGVAVTSVPIPIGDGYISGLKVAVAKPYGPPYIGELVFSVTPAGGGAATVYKCGTAGGVPVPLFTPKEGLAAYNLATHCLPDPARGGGGRRRRRRLAQTTLLDTGKVLVLDGLTTEVAAAPVGAAAAVGTASAGTASAARVPTAALNGVPLAGPLTVPQKVAVAAVNGVSAKAAWGALPQLIAASPPPPPSPPVSAITVPAYVFDANSGKIYTCQITAGAVPAASACVAATGFGNWRGYIAASSSYLFLPTHTNVRSCPLTANLPPSAGGCTTQAYTGGDSGVALAGAYGYVLGHYNLYSCPLTAGGALPPSSACTSTSIGGFHSGLSAVAAAPAYAYPTDDSTSDVLSCPIGAGGVVSATCSSTSGFSAVTTTAATAAAVFVPDGQVVRSCPTTAGVMPSTTSGCTSMTGFSSSSGVAVNAAGTYLYATDSVTGNVYSCAIGSGGSLPATVAGCSVGTGFGGAVSIAVP